MKSLLVSTTILAACIAAYCNPSFAQQNPGGKPASDQQRQFLQTFKENVAKGCMQNPPKGIANAGKYCECYAQSFVKRYQPNELAQLATAANAAPQNAQLISFMMIPERRSCLMPK